MTQEDQKVEPQAELATISEVAIAYLNVIEDTLSVLNSHIKNNELAEAEEALELITTETTELRTFLLQAEREEK